MDTMTDKAECLTISDVFDNLGEYFQQIAAYTYNWNNKLFCKRHIGFIRTLKRFLENRISEDGNKCPPRYKQQLAAVNKAYWIMFRRVYGREQKSERMSK